MWLMHLFEYSGGLHSIEVFCCIFSALKWCWVTCSWVSLMYVQRQQWWFCGGAGNGEVQATLGK